MELPVSMHAEIEAKLKVNSLEAPNAVRPFARKNSRRTVTSTPPTES